MEIYPYQFTGEIVKHHMGKDLYYAVVFLPNALKPVLPLEEFPRLRINAEVAGVPLQAALMPVRGEWYILLSAKLRKRVGVEIGDTVDVAFGVGDQDAVDVPPVLAEALAAAPDIKEVWEAMTPGKRRGLAYRVGSAKTPPTRIKRVDEVLALLADG